MRHTPRIAAAALAGTLGAVLVLSTGAVAQTTSPQAARQADFAAAAAEFGVPESVLLAVSYQETLWEAHRGLPSSTGQYGPMALANLRAATDSAKGDGPAPASTDTMTTAAKLIGANPTSLTTDEKDNIRGGAALLASYGKALNHGSLPASTGDWYAAVAKYSGDATQDGAARFANDVFGTIKSGASRHTDDGQSVTLAADPSVRADTAGLASLKLTKEAADTQAPECPKNLNCTFIPAAYAPDSSAVGDYGNYDLADRPNNGVTINYIVIHDTEESYDSTVAGFQNPADYVSANYVVRGSDGTVTQMVPDSDVAWHAGNWYMNAHAIGIEQEGYAVQGATWFTERLYQTTASLVRYLAARYHIPVDRQHIIGHDNVPGINTAGIAAMHWDPGPFWNWGHFMDLLGSKTVPTGSAHSKVVTINPVFQQNVQTVTDCEAANAPVTQAASFVWLRTAPSADAPLFNDPGLHPDSAAGTAGTTCAADWGDKASAGQQFAVADRQGDWVAIWWDGAKVWFENPKNQRTATPTSTLVVKPKAGLASVPTFGVAYPDPSEFPSDIPARTVTPLTYSILAGQSYVYGGVTPTDFYYAVSYDNSVPHDHTNVTGTEKYLEIQLGHRIAFVRATDVDVVPAVG